MNRANCGTGTKIDKQNNGRKQSPERDLHVYGHLAQDKSGERMGFAINGAETVGYPLALGFIHTMKGTDLIFFVSC